ncbi:MAG: lactate/malate dehydrogenase family protein [Pirellulales bacterium]|nr:lactate/malate dehydrogenase family protein [Pirellulales bacterium]
MKVSIIGGGGLVGSCAAFALQTSGIVRELALLDVNEDMAVGHALDLIHGATLCADQQIAAGGYEHIANSDLICITAGLRRKPDESRLDLINRNVALFEDILQQVITARLRDDAIVLVVSNPVDILTYLATQRLPVPPSRILGLGTVLDTIRFRGLIARQLTAPATQVSALVLGEHGDSMTPIWSSATIGGLPLEKFPGWTASVASDVFEQTKRSGAEVIAKKEGAGFAVGIAIREVIESIALDRRRVLPISSLQQGCYGIHGVALSVPTVIGRAGVIGTSEIELWPKEISGIQRSASVLRETLSQVLGS